MEYDKEKMELLRKIIKELKEELKDKNNIKRICIGDWHEIVETKNYLIEYEIKTIFSQKLVIKFSKFKEIKFYDRTASLLWKEIKNELKLNELCRELLKL